MKLNISYPATGCQKVVEIEDENKLRAFYDKRISAEVSGDALGDDFAGYVFKISGGNDKQGFAMKQGVLTASRVRILFRDGMSGYRPRKRGERKRKSTRGCIVSSDLSVLNLVVIKKGANEIEGLTDTQKPRRLGPKRASKIRKLFNLSHEDDVRKYVVKHKKKIGKKENVLKGPKIQRLVTPERLRRRVVLKKRMAARREKTASEREQYAALLKKRKRESSDANKQRKKARVAQAEAIGTSATRVDGRNQSHQATA